MAIYRTDFLSNPNVGLFGYAGEGFCLLGEHIPEEQVKKVRKALGVGVHQVRLCGTELIGVFCAGNSSALLVPEIVFDNEFEKLKALGCSPAIIETELTALGNNILCNDTGCVLSPDFPDDTVKQIQKALKVPAVRGTIGELHNVGALAVLSGSACVVSPDATEGERKFIEETLGVRCVEGTANMGMPYLRAAVLANSKGMVISAACSGVEIANIDNAFFSNRNKPL